MLVGKMSTYLMGDSWEFVYMRNQFPMLTQALWLSWCQAKWNILILLAKELKIINIAIDCPVLMMKLPVLLPKTCHHLIEHGVSNDPTFLPKVEKMIVHKPYELAFQSVSRQFHWLTTICALTYTDNATHQNLRLKSCSSLTLWFILLYWFQMIIDNFSEMTVWFMRFNASFVC